MYYSNCGAQVWKDEKFCTNCGKKVNVNNSGMEEVSEIDKMVPDK